VVVGVVAAWADRRARAVPVPTASVERVTVLSVCNVSTEDMATEDNGNEDAYMSKSLIAIRIYCMSIFLRIFCLPGSKVIATLAAHT